ncbi:MAG: hypothetical protein ABIT83_20195 [Massilia sp.]
MAPATATRSRPAQPRTPPLGTGELHHALEDARDLKCLHAFCDSLACTSADVSTDGIRLNVVRILDLMRRRGYLVADPVKRPAPGVKGQTAWHVVITIPAGPTFALGFCTPDTS